MSTEYTIHTGDGGVALELWEHSAVLDLALTSGEHSKVVIPDLTPAEVVALAIQALKVASYQIDIDDFRAAIAAAIKADPYGIGPICADVGDVARKGG